MLEPQDLDLHTDASEETTNDEEASVPEQDDEDQRQMSNSLPTMQLTQFTAITYEMQQSVHFSYF